MKDNTKITLTVGQLKKLVNEANKRVDWDDIAQDDPEWAKWGKADDALKAKKREIAKKGKALFKQLYNQYRTEFINEMSKEFVDNNLSYHADRPKDAAWNLLYDLESEDPSVSIITDEIYLFSKTRF